MKCSRAWSLGAGLSSGRFRVTRACWKPRGGTGPLGAVRLVRLIADHMREIHTGILAAARQDADVLLLTGLSTIGGYHIAEGLGLPSMGLALQPVYPTGEFPPSIVSELRADLGLPRHGYSCSRLKAGRGDLESQSRGSPMKAGMRASVQQGRPRSEGGRAGRVVRVVAGSGR